MAQMRKTVLQNQVSDCGDDAVVCLTVANGRLYFCSCFKILCERDSDPLKDFFLNQFDMYIHH